MCLKLWHWRGRGLAGNKKRLDLNEPVSQLGVLRHQLIETVQQSVQGQKRNGSEVVVRRVRCRWTFSGIRVWCITPKNVLLRNPTIRAISERKIHTKRCCAAVAQISVVWNGTRKTTVKLLAWDKVVLSVVQGGYKTMEPI